jgi:glycosidase
MGRDNVRTPVQWDYTHHAGFCAENVDPWIALNPNFDRINVASQEGDPESILSFYKKVIAFRKAHRGLVYNDVDVWTLDHDQLFCYLRPATTNGIENEFQSYAVMHNMSDKPTEVSLPDDPAKQTVSKSQATDGTSMHLEPWESVVWSVE